MRTVIAFGLWHFTKMGMGKLPVVTEMLYIFILLVVTQLDSFIKMYQIVHLKVAYFTIYKLHFAFKKLLFAISC